MKKILTKEILKEIKDFERYTRMVPTAKLKALQKKIEERVNASE